jgi:hypothetical protein
MIVPPTDSWKVVLAVLLGAGIFASAYAHAPRRAVAGADLRRLVFSAVALYAVGGVASLTHHPVIATVVYATGIIVCALAAWLSRGSDSEDPPGGEQPVDEQPPAGPDGLPQFDWTAFERDFRAYSRREREPAGIP